MANSDTDVVLLVEDDPNDQLLIQRSFQKASAGARVIVVGSGDEALSYLSAVERSPASEDYPLPKIVLLDLKLPGISGLDVLAWVKRQPIINKIPVVVLSSSGQERDVRKAYELGVDSYFVKPVDLGDLEYLIAQIAADWHAGASPHAC